MSEERPATYFDDAAAWRAWLQKHHATEKELWLGFWKKHTNHAGLTYEDAVEQALCFGWIDGVLNRVDDRRHRIRFTPRRPGSNWSKVNVEKVAELERRGLMTEAGRTAHEAGRSDHRIQYAYQHGEEVELDPEYVAQLAASPGARSWFESQRPSYQRDVKRWVMSAKQKATRDRRMAEVVADSEAGRPVKPLRLGGNNSPR
ncbi:MAG TPA: YdeI/OmpD-associated family protein [Nocardioidaceae bacterium]|nr:YdeI/OmpD-associated family protein [Nocardioidaceae bacterium]